MNSIRKFYNQTANFCIYNLKYIFYKNKLYLLLDKYDKRDNREKLKKNQRENKNKSFYKEKSYRVVILLK
jgi:hypothetical protein